MKTNTKFILCLAGAALILAVGVLLSIHNFDECRAHGFSMIYCLAQI